MKKEEHQFKLAKIAIKRFFTVLVLLAALWMVFQHNPTKLVTSINLKEQSIDINCEFASDVLYLVVAFVVAGIVELLGKI